MGETNHILIAGRTGLSVSVVGFVVLLGWQFDIDFLKRISPGFTAMNPVTAFGLLLSGLTIFLFTLKRIYILLISGLSFLLILIGIIKLSDFIFQTNFGIDEWLFNQQIASEKLTGVASRISPATALNFILIGMSLWLSMNKKTAGRIAANYLALFVFLIGLLFTLGYIFSVPEFKTVLAVYPMAIHTAVCFLVISFSVSLLNHDYGFMKSFTGSDSGGFVSRVFMPFTFSVAFFIGFILLYLLYFYAISSEMIIALGAGSVILCSFLLSWFIAVRINSVEALKEKAQVERQNLNNELERSNERFLKIFKTSPVATVISNINDGRFVYVNDAFLKLFSFSQEEVIGRTSVELKMLDEEARFSLLKQFQESNFIFNDKEVTLLDANGKAINLLSSAQRIEINGELHLLNTLIDITERKAIELQIIKSRKSLNDAQKLSKTGSWEFNLKTKELFWSDELYNIFELKETPADKLFEACRKKIHPDDLINLDKSISLANEKGEAAVYEHRIILNDGSIRYLLGLGEVLKSETGEPEWLRGTTQDITERKFFETSLKETRDSLSAAQKIAHLGSWEWNIKTNEERWSEEQFRIFGYKPDEVKVTYELFQNALHPDDRATVLFEVQQALESGKPFFTEYRIIRKDGAVRNIEAKARLEYDVEGKPDKMIGTVLDITERKETEEKLKQYYIQLDIKNKELEQFAFIASHDLQEPLSTISSFTDLLTEEYSPKLDENANTYIRFVSQSANRMRTLITNLLDYSRIGNNRLLQKTDSNEVLKNVLDNLQATIKENSAIISCDKLPALMAYPVELELLFQNLIGNAIKFRKKNVAPQVNITAEKTATGWQFAFADNGIGIDEKYFEKIFLLFQRLHGQDNYKGSGIGLSHCKKIVELHNGTIWVKSKPGEGSVFYFIIPELKN